MPTRPCPASPRWWTGRRRSSSPRRTSPGPGPSRCGGRESVFLLPVPLPSCVSSGNPAGFPPNRGGFLIADSYNFAVSSEYRTPVHFVPWRSSVFPGQGLRTRRALGGAGWGLAGPRSRGLLSRQRPLVIHRGDPVQRRVPAVVVVAANCGQNSRTKPLHPAAAGTPGRRTRQRRRPAHRSRRQPRTAPPRRPPTRRCAASARSKPPPATVLFLAVRNLEEWSFVSLRPSLADQLQAAAGVLGVSVAGSQRVAGQHA